jgi:hypothetical protein
MENLIPRKNKIILIFITCFILSLSVSCQSKETIKIIVENNANELIFIKLDRNNSGSVRDTIFLNNENIGVARGYKEETLLNASYRVLFRDSIGKLKILEEFSEHKSMNNNIIYFSHGFTINNGDDLMIIMAVGNRKYMRTFMKDDNFIQSKTFEDKLDRAFQVK